MSEKSGTFIFQLRPSMFQFDVNVNGIDVPKHEVQCLFNTGNVLTSVRISNEYLCDRWIAEQFLPKECFEDKEDE